MRKLIHIPAEMRWGLVLLPWSAAALGILTVKFWRLRAGGFHDTALFMGEAKLRIGQSLALFRVDLLILVLLIPALILLVTTPLSRRAAIKVCALAAGLFLLLTLFEINVWDQTGSFTSFRLVYSLLAWEVASGDHSFVLIRPNVLLGGCAMFLILGASTWLAFIVIRRRPGRFEKAELTCFAAVCLLGIATWIPAAPSGAWAPSLLGQSFYSFFLRNTVTGWKIKRMEAKGAAQLTAQYRADSRVPEPQPSPYFGKARNANIVIFTMESMSAHALDPAQDSLADMPNLRRLREHSFVMERHYTSFPQTDYALFSMLTSLYAQCYMMCSGNELIQDSGSQLPSLMSVLRGAGYRTAFYGYVWHFSDQRDDLLLKSLGFESVGEPVDSAADRHGLTAFYGPIRYVEGIDLQALSRLRRDIHQWTGSKERFAAMYFPEVGHDPYRAPDGDENAPSLARGHALAVMQDAWLGQIMDELRQDGVLDNTIIVVTGDHGMRFNTIQANGMRTLTSNGKLDDVVMRVPMLVYVPQALDHTVPIDYPTSHIDLMPTLLDLLGSTEGQAYAQGSPMMDPRIRDRRLYLPMGTYGAFGYFDRGAYFMMTQMGEVYKSNTMQFSDHNAIVYNGPEAESARRIEETYDITQAALLYHLLHPGS